MNIDRSNYESFFIDYIDGTLPDELINDLLDFLSANPDLAEEVKTVSTIKLQPEKLTFPDKNSLFKPTTPQAEPADYRAVAYFEGDLQDKEKAAFETELAENDELLKTMQLLAKTKLQPNLAVVFPDKEKLQRKNRRTVYLRWVQAAAVLLLFAGLWAVLPRNKVLEPEQPLAQQQTAAPMPEQNPTNKKQLPGLTANAENPEQTTAQKPTNQVVKNQAQTHQLRAKANNNQTPEENTINQLPQREPAPDKIRPLLQPVAIAGFNPQKVRMEIAAPVAAEPVQQTLSVEQYLAHKLVSAPKGENFTLANLSNAGLTVAQNLSNDRLEVERAENGRPGQIRFESRLLAFSIPINKNR